MVTADTTQRSTLSQEQLQRQAAQMRIDILKMIHAANSGHPGGSLSAVEICSWLLFAEMKHRPQEPRWQDRDRFIISKGHGVPVWYTALAHAGYFPREDLMTLRTLGSRLQGHPDCVMMDSMEASTGSLGQGLSVALGMALAGQLDQKDWRVFCLIGDGEIQEGQIWEALMSAPKFKLDNLCVILDNNRIQLDGRVADTMPVEPVDEKARAFGWNVIRIDGHDWDQLADAFGQARSTKGVPTFIVADTVKGKGVSFMEDNVAWHGKVPSDEQLQQAIGELEAQLKG